MSKKDPRVDDYIARAAEFAKPILRRLRKLIHTACPQAEETMKWKFPFFTHQGILAGTPAFRNHCSLVFWKGQAILGGEKKKFMRLESAADLPGDKILLGYLKKAVELNETGARAAVRPKPKARRISVPGYFQAALAKNKKARATFQKLPPSHQREYVEWITQAKRDETRFRRLATAVKWLAQGKAFNWKYR